MSMNAVRARASAWALAALVSGFAGRGFAQTAVDVTGTVRDETGRPLAGVAVVEEGSGSGPRAQTDENGAFRLTLGPGTHVLRANGAGRATVRENVTIAADADAAVVEIAMGPAYRVSEDVVVQALRADAKAPVTKTDLDRQELARIDHGQEIPFLLKETPSITQYSETGIGAGYAYFYLRGIQQTRLNLTLDGVPLNEAEDSTLYFTDFEGLAASLDSIQIQRGVGTSSVGSASFGGAVNFESVALADAPSASALLGGGSFGTWRANVAGETGRLGPGWALYARALFAGTDGFRDHSGVTPHTVFFGARQQGDKSFFKLFGFSGREKTELAFLAVEKDLLEQDLRQNPLSPNEKDAFGQDFVQAQWTRVLGDSSTLALQGYYNGAQGFYRLYSDAEQTDLRQYDLDWRFIGAFATFNHERGRFGLTAGLHLNDFDSEHAREPVDGPRDYSNQGHKNDASAFLKAHYDAGRVRLFGDAQVRHPWFRYEGDLDIGSVSWTFWNPKVGARFTIDPTWSVYASLGRTTREPTRGDMFTGEDNPTVVYDLHAVKPERVTDLEAGVEYQARRFQVKANLYAMEFRNEIALTGELSDIGQPLRRNVDESYRRGFELEARYQPTPSLRVTASANANASRIATWNQAIDVYDAEGNWTGSEVVPYHDVRPLLTPAFVGNLGADWSPNPVLTVGLSGRYVDTAYLDNTGNAATTTPDFWNLDGSLSLSFARWIRSGEPRLRVQVNNVFGNDHQWPSGYSYLFFSGRADGGRDLVATPYYYPLATRSVFVSLDVKF
jgi:iron complex outermembrane receptor protein